MLLFLIQWSWKPITRKLFWIFRISCLITLVLSVNSCFILLSGESTTCTVGFSDIAGGLGTAGGFTEAMGWAAFSPALASGFTAWTGASAFASGFEAGFPALGVSAFTSCLAADFSVLGASGLEVDFSALVGSAFASGLEVDFSALAGSAFSSGLEVDFSALAGSAFSSDLEVDFSALVGSTFSSDLREVFSTLAGPAFTPGFNTALGRATIPTFSMPSVFTVFVSGSFIYIGSFHCPGADDSGCSIRMERFRFFCNSGRRRERRLFCPPASGRRDGHRSRRLMRRFRLPRCQHGNSRHCQRGLHPAGLVPYWLPAPCRTYICHLPGLAPQA